VNETALELPEGAVVEPPDVRLLPANQPAGPVIEALLTALRQGTISPKLGREMLIRLVPPAKATVRLRLPPITDAASFARACRLIMRANATGKITPADAAVLLRNAKATFEATRAEQRMRLLGR
jgi:hypothetical protein